jgi:hypothetical protein
MMKHKLTISIILIAVIQMACGVPLRGGTYPVPAPVPVNKDTANLPFAPETSTWVVCDSGGLNVRDGAGIEYHIIGGLQDGDEVEVIGHKADSYGKMWALIDEGWVNERYLCN